MGICMPRYYLLRMRFVVLLFSMFIHLWNMHHSSDSLDTTHFIHFHHIICQLLSIYYVEFVLGIHSKCNDILFMIFFKYFFVLLSTNLQKVSTSLCSICIKWLEKYRAKIQPEKGSNIHEWERIKLLNWGPILKPYAQR